MKRKPKKEKGKRRMLVAVALLGMAIGMGILLYPVISDWSSNLKNEKSISRMNAVYDRYRDDPMTGLIWDRAVLYNKKLAGKYEGEVLPYGQQLDICGDGTMGYVEIPGINLKMVIYHGTGDEVLAAGVGHLEGTSLPVGGESTHAVLTAHSGLETMKAFDDIRKLTEGDTITIVTLGKKMNYRVFQVETVLPWETDSLKIQEGKDMVTLVTCTPYGINDHRLLVHAERSA